MQCFSLHSSGLGPTVARFIGKDGAKVGLFKLRSFRIARIWLRYDPGPIDFSHIRYVATFTHHHPFFCLASHAPNSVIRAQGQCLAL